MMPTFFPPSYRASQSDLTVAVSPLGLVELADEEFEVHGPRLSRYAVSWAWYLGHHYGYRREVGEPQFSVNFVRTFADYIANFVFGEGISFRTPPATAGIVPPVLKRVWEVDNDKAQVLLEMGQIGGVTGDLFVKVAYEDPFVDSAGILHPGRVRIIPLNSAHCFPTFSPHDRKRLERFKLKYRFWASMPDGTRGVNTYCVDDKTEALTRRGWLTHEELTIDDEVLAVDPDSGRITWEPVLAVNRFPWDGDLVRWQSKTIDALTTPNHRWMVQDWRENDPVRADRAKWSGGFRETQDITTQQIAVAGGDPRELFASTPVYSDEFVELLAWVVAEGNFYFDAKRQNLKASAVTVAQSQTHNPEHCERLRRLVKHFSDQGATASEHVGTPIHFYFGKGIGNLIRAALPYKQMTPELLCSFTYEQALLFHQTLMDGDGHRRVKDGSGTEIWAQQDQRRVDAFQMLSSMLGKGTNARPSKHSDCTYTTVYKRKYATPRYFDSRFEHYEGVVWCPSVRTKTWMARRNGVTYWTGNTEIVSEVGIEEYVNDELISARPNPLGRIPIVHIPNRPVSGSPWGLSDIFDIIALNREYNEKMLELSDIINYHASPVHVVIGAKTNQLQKGPRAIWGLPKDAKVDTLQAIEDFTPSLGYLQALKRNMHEITGVPENALGEEQPISNTSGVALHIQYQPLMNVRRQKTTQYGVGIKQINELVLLTLFQKEPWTMEFDPKEDTEPIPGQLLKLDPNDPNTYETAVHWPSPLPVDKLVKLNEIMMQKQLGLISDRESLMELGEEFPDQKRAEIFDEQLEDIKRQGALRLAQSAVDMAVMLATGVPPGGDVATGGTNSGTVGGATPGGDGNEGPGAPPKIAVTPEVQQMIAELAVRAAGTKLAQYRNPSSTADD